MAAVTYSIPDFNSHCADAVNNHIKKAMNTMYFYTAMAIYFQNFTVALPGMYSFSEAAADRHLDEVRFFVKYQNKRAGGKAILPDLPSPQYTFTSALKAMESAQSKENDIYSDLITLRESAAKHNDYEMIQTVEDKMTSQIHVIKYIGDFVTQLGRVGPGNGEFYFDYQLEGQVGEDRNKTF